MELKEFVKGVLTQITDAVKESQEEINNGAIIVPRYTILNSTRTDKGLPITMVEFDLCVTNSEESGKEKGINVMFTPIRLKHEKTDKNSEIKENRIRFSIPVLFPEHLRK